jgi:hypothetical protein
MICKAMHSHLLGHLSVHWRTLETAKQGYKQLIGLRAIPACSSFAHYHDTLRNLLIYSAAALKLGKGLDAVDEAH